MESIQLIAQSFPKLFSDQFDKLEKYVQLLLDWNSQVNLISRKNTEHVWSQHILHSLMILHVVEFKPGQKVLDVGTGGGLPGIPLAIIFPDVEFLLVDSIGKKVNAVTDMARQLGLKNVKTQQVRAEELNEKFDFVVSRAVTRLPVFYQWIQGKIRSGQEANLPNGVIYIKGGDFEDELEEIKAFYKLWEMSDWSSDPFFETKRLVWLGI